MAEQLQRLCDAYELDRCPAERRGGLSGVLSQSAGIALTEREWESLALTQQYPCEVPRADWSQTQQRSQLVVQASGQRQTQD